MGWKVIRYDGVAEVTSDEIAEAVMDLAIALAKYSRWESVTFPILSEEQVGHLTLMLGPTVHVALLSGPADVGRGAIPGAAEAAALIRRRAAHLTDPLANLREEQDAIAREFEAWLQEES